VAGLTGFDGAANVGVMHETVRQERDEWLTPAEAAERVGLSTRTLERYVKAGDLKAALTVGGHRRYRASDIDALLKDAS
jgi:excisionase family DNA binding protein